MRGGDGWISCDVTTLRLLSSFGFVGPAGDTRSTLVEGWNDGGRDACDVALAVRVVEEQETANLLSASRMSHPIFLAATRSLSR